MNRQNLLSKEEVIKLVKPYAEKIYDKIFLGFSDYLFHDSDVGHIHDKTTKSNVIRSRIINRIKELILEMPKWRWVVKNRMICIVIEGKIWLRFKKLNNNFRTRNVSTDQVDDFRDQKKLEKTIASKYINVDIGWLLNEFYNEIKDIYIVAPDGDKNMWRVRFKPQGIQTGTVIPMFRDTKEDQKNQILIAKIKPEYRKNKNKSDEANQ